MPAVRACLARALLIGALGLVLTGCRLDVGVEVEVDRRGGGTLAVVLVADEELQERAQAAGIDPLGDVVAAGQQLRGAGWRTADRTDADGGRTVRLAAPYASPAELQAISGQLADALAGPEVRPLERFELALDEDTLTLTGAASLVPTEAVAEAGLEPAAAVEALADALRLRVQVVLPGAVLESTASQVQGSVLTWEVAPGDQVALRAVGQRPGTGWLAPLLGGLLGAVVAVAVLRVIALRRRRAVVVEVPPAGWRA